MLSFMYTYLTDKFQMWLAVEQISPDSFSYINENIGGSGLNILFKRKKKN